jgi:cytochrome c-type biogenesis protein CcmF
VTRDGAPVVTLHPEKRVYDVSKRPTTEAAIHTTFFGDLYVVIGDAAEGSIGDAAEGSIGDAAEGSIGDAAEGSDDKDETGAYVTRLYFNPLVAWIWAGVLVMVMGGVLSLSDRRHRVGAPTRRRGAGLAQAAGA